MQREREKERDSRMLNQQPTNIDMKQNHCNENDKSKSINDYRGSNSNRDSNRDNKDSAQNSFFKQLLTKNN